MIKAMIGLIGLGMSYVVLAENLPASMDLQAQPLNTVVSLYYKEIVKRPYVICNDVIQDSRLVSIRAGGKTLDAAMVATLLETYGYEAREDRGVTVVCNKPKTAEQEQYEPMVYRPQYRDAAYLVDLLTPLVKGTFANKRATQSSLTVGGATAQPAGVMIGAPGTLPAAGAAIPASIAPSMKPNLGDDYILFNGSEREQGRLRKLLAQVDVPSGEVLIKGYVYEVGKNSNEASAIDMLASLLEGKLQISVSGPILGNALRIKTGGIDLVASAINSDGRFKVVSSPFVRVSSGESARLQVGANVPVLGAILTTAAGSSQQSVEYRSTGTILDVTPKVRDKATFVTLAQQVSSFATTESGVNGSPTFNTRELKTSLTVEDGEVLVIGGLNDSKEDESRSGLWFLPFATSKSGTARSSELVLILELKRV